MSCLHGTVKPFNDGCSIVFRSAYHAQMDARVHAEARRIGSNNELAGEIARLKEQVVSQESLLAAKQVNVHSLFSYANVFVHTIGEVTIVDTLSARNSHWICANHHLRKLQVCRKHVYWGFTV